MRVKICEYTVAQRQQINSNFNIVTETKAKCVHTNADQLRNNIELEIFSWCCAELLNPVGVTIL